MTLEWRHLQDCKKLKVSARSSYANESLNPQKVETSNRVPLEEFLSGLLDSSDMQAPIALTRLCPTGIYY